MVRLPFAGLAAAALAFAAIAQPAAAMTPGRVAFDVYRNGKLEGSHVVEARRVAEGLKVDVKIDLAGRVGPFAYAYAHRCEELWNGGAIARVSCVDQERGKPEKRLSAEREGGQLVVRSGEGAKAAPASVVPSSWWNAALMRQSRMLDTRSGQVTPIAVERLGVEQVETPSGAVAATRYRVTGSAPAEIWYDAEGRWVRMAFRLRGQRFEYRLTTPPDAAPRA